MGRLKGSLEFKFRASKGYDRMAGLFEHKLVELRYAAIRKYLAHEAAQTMLAAVREKIPQKPQFSTYRDALQVVQSGPPDNPVFSVYAKPSKQQPVEEEKDILFLKLTQKRRPTPPEILVLMAHQPWTQDTLPFDVDKKFAKLIIRKTSAREVAAVRKARQEDKPKWQQSLNRLGIQAVPKKLDKPVQGTEDVAYTALRLEFGLGGTQPVAHWRPAMKTVEQRVQQIAKSGILVRALADWRFSGWQKWADITAPVVSSKAVAASRAFEDKLG